MRLWAVEKQLIPVSRRSWALLVSRRSWALFDCEDGTSQASSLRGRIIIIILIIIIIIEIFQHEGKANLCLLKRVYRLFMAIRMNQTTIHSNEYQSTKASLYLYLYRVPHVSTKGEVDILHLFHVSQI